MMDCVACITLLSLEVGQLIMKNHVVMQFGQFTF